MLYNSQDLLNRIIDAGHPLYLCRGTSGTSTITRKNWDDEIQVMDRLKALWDDAGLSEPFEVNLDLQVCPWHFYSSIFLLEWVWY